MRCTHPECGRSSELPRESNMEALFVEGICLYFTWFISQSVFLSDIKMNTIFTSTPSFTISQLPPPSLTPSYPITPATLPPPLTPLSPQLSPLSLFTQDLSFPTPHHLIPRPTLLNSFPTPSPPLTSPSLPSIPLPHSSPSLSQP